MRLPRSLPARISLLLICISTILSQIAYAQSTQPIALPNQPSSPGVTGDWGGYRSKLVDQGLTVAAAVYYDYSKNFQGGISTAKYASRDFFDLDLTFTTDQTLHWHGGTFFFNFLDHEGTDGTKTLVGDAQNFDNQDGPRSSQIYQLYFQQLFANDKLRFKIGRIDSTTDFAYVANSTSFLNASFGYSPTLTSFPTYPDPAIGSALFWTPNDHFYASADVSYISQADRTGILSGSPYVVNPTAGGVFFIAELGAKWTLGNNKVPGRLSVGGFYHTGEFQRFNQTEQRGASGMYAVIDQTVNNNLGIFAQFGLADANISPIDVHVGTGFQWTGPIPTKTRSADVLGVGPTFAHLSNQSDHSRDYELAIEGFYKLQLTPWFNVQPDLQYILNPSGQANRDAVVATIRAELDF